MLVVNLILLLILTITFGMVLMSTWDKKKAKDAKPSDDDRINAIIKRGMDLTPILKDRLNKAGDEFVARAKWSSAHSVANLFVLLLNIFVLHNDLLSSVVLVSMIWNNLLLVNQKDYLDFNEDTLTKLEEEQNGK